MVMQLHQPIHCCVLNAEVGLSTLPPLVVET